MTSDHAANFGIYLLRLTRCGECDGDNDGGKFDARCTDNLAARNNTHMGFPRTDNSERTGAGSTRKDSN